MRVWQGCLWALALAGWATGAAAAPPAVATGAAGCPPQPAALTPAEQQAVAADRTERGFLFEATRTGKDGAQQQVWLYGTLHVGRRDAFNPGPALAAALQSADQIALELDVLDPATQQRLLRAAGKPARAPLPAALARQLAAARAAACLPQEVARSHPVLQAVTVALAQAQRLGYSAQFGTDLLLTSGARQLHKPVVALETPESQLAALTGGTPADQQAFIAKTLAQLDSGENQRVLLRLAQAWADQNWADLASWRDWCACATTAGERADLKRLLDDRNPQMARRITALADAGRRPLVAVGAAHLVGDSGLPALLAAQGWQVRRLSPRGGIGFGVGNPATMTQRPAPAAAPVPTPNPATTEERKQP